MKKFAVQVVAVVATILFFMVAGLSAGIDNKAPMMLPVDTAKLTITTGSGEVALDVEVARTNAERGMGLMFRDKLPENRGMLFVFEDNDILNFWMHNTPQPLDIVYLDENGVIVTIKPGAAMADDIISSEVPARYVLEVAAGEAARLHLAEGDKMQHPAIVPFAK